MTIFGMFGFAEPTAESMTIEDAQFFKAFKASIGIEVESEEQAELFAEGIIAKNRGLSKDEIIKIYKDTKL